MDMFDEIPKKAKSIVSDDAEDGRTLYESGLPRPHGHKLRDRTLQRGWDEAAAESRTAPRRSR